MNIGEKSKNFVSRIKEKEKEKEFCENFVKNNCLYFYKYPPASSEHFIKIASEVAEFRPVVIKTRKKKKGKKANFAENSHVVSRLSKQLLPTRVKMCRSLLSRF